MPSEYEDERELDDYNSEDCDCDAYWKLQCRVHTTRREAQRKARPFSIPKGVSTYRAIELCRRVQRGLLWYIPIPNADLRKFIDDRGLQTVHNYNAIATTKTASIIPKNELVQILEKADDEATFERFTELPPELRSRVYELHFQSFEEPLYAPSQPPITKVSKLLRTESTPLFYQNVSVRLWTNPNLQVSHWTKDLPVSQAFVSNTSEEHIPMLRRFCLSCSRPELGNYDIDLVRGIVSCKTSNQCFAAVQRWAHIKSIMEKRLGETAKDIAARSGLRKMLLSDLGSFLDAEGAAVREWEAMSG